MSLSTSTHEWTFLMYLISCEKKSRKKVGKKTGKSVEKKSKKKKRYNGEKKVEKKFGKKKNLKTRKKWSEEKSSAKFAWYLLGSKKKSFHVFSFFLSFFAVRFLFSPLRFWFCREFLFISVVVVAMRYFVFALTLRFVNSRSHQRIFFTRVGRTIAQQIGQSYARSVGHNQTSWTAINIISLDTFAGSRGWNKGLLTV